MKEFLEKTASYIYEKYGQNARQTCLVVPNRRAGLYFRRHYASAARSTVWLPDVYSLEDFLIELSGLVFVDNISMIFIIYDEYCKITKGEHENIEDFLDYGRMIFSDFNEADLYLTDIKSLFTYLNDIQNISSWAPGENGLSPGQKKYADFYSSLYPVYLAVTNRLLQEKKAYQGLIYRKVAENIDEHAAKMKWDNLVFTGFNALTASEEKIIIHLYKQGRADILWDADNYYIDNEISEAGKFLRKYRKIIGKDKFRWTEDNYLNNKEIEIISVPKNIGQVKIAGQLLEEKTFLRDQAEKTAIVLADESLLTPLMTSLPRQVTDFNITMGYPLKYTSLYNLAEDFFNLHLNAAKLASLRPENEQVKSGQARFYFKDILKVINNPVTSSLFNDQSHLLSQLVNRIGSTGKIFYKSNEFLAIVAGQELLSYFGLFMKSGNWLANLQEIIEMATAKFSQEEGSADEIPEVLYAPEIIKIIRKLQGLLNEHQFTANLKATYGLFRQVSGSTTIPFSGEPLKGIQVMGLLETRLLDFENIIFLSLNDDIIPSGKKMHSFIPPDVKGRFGLPLYTERDAIYAYHFYRLLQRCGKAYLIYNSEPGNLGGGEKSRFITQLINELPAWSRNVKISEKVLVTPSPVNKDIHEEGIVKNENVIISLKKLAQYKFSPTMLNDYRTCQMLFYFRRVAGLKEPEEVTEEMDARDLGNIIHDSLHHLYKPFLQRPLNEKDIRRMIGESERVTENIIAGQHQHKESDTGKNLLTVKIAGNFIHRFLIRELEYVNELNAGGHTITVTGLEKEFMSDFSFPNGLGIDKIKLYGKADRIDIAGGIMRVIDYKTGSINVPDMGIPSREEFESEPKYNIPFQLLLYSYLFNQSHGNLDFQSGVFSFRNMSKGFIPVCYNQSELIGSDVVNMFGDILKKLLSEIFNPEMPFSKTAKTENCKFCPFTMICVR